jgi:hypothetical protein
MGTFTDNVMGNYNQKLANTKIADFPRYDFFKEVKPQARYLTPVAWALSYPDVWKHKTHFYRDLQGVKPPYLLLCNHNSFFDFKVMTAAIFPKRANYVVALDGFIGREWIMREVGCIAKRKFVNDLELIRQTVKLLKQNQIVAYYPEARYSLIGTDAILPESLGKMIRFLKVPVVTLISHGHHINEPAWNQTNRGVPTSTELKLLLTQQEVETLDAKTIQQRVEEGFEYDDFAWQFENKIVQDAPDRAEGLHRVLYQCPHCQTEYRMNSQGSEIFCEACGKHWQLTEYGQLQAVEGDTEFPHPPDWYEWERANVRREIEAGTYALECEVLVDSLPNSDGFVQMGKGWLRHDMDGIILRGEYLGEKFEVVKTVPSLYSIHIEYNYIDKKMDCIDVSTLDDTYFVYPTTRDASVTKVSLAVEELYKLKVREAR